MKRLLFLFFILLCVLLVIVRSNRVQTAQDEIDEAKEPLVSVVMPVYNREDLVSKAIESILEQTYSHFEFIIVDDASSDKTPDILKEYAKKDKRIKILKNEKNCGISCSRNKGMEAAVGKYIAVMDSDDVALPIRLEKTVKVMEDHPQLAVVSGSLALIQGKVDPKWMENPLEYNFRLQPEQIQFTLHFSNNLYNVCTLIRRQFVMDHQIRYNVEYISAEDYDFWKQILMKGGKMANLTNPVMLVRFHRTNPAVYYSEMTDKTFKIKRELFERFFPVTKEEIKWTYGAPEKCELLNKMAKANAQKEIVNQQELIKFTENICPKEGQKYVYLKHPNWESFVILEEKERAYRHPGNIGATFLIEGNVLTMKWDRWPSEKFIKTQEGIYKFMDPKAIKAKHPHWTDELVFKEAAKICRTKAKDCGTVVNKKEDRISIKWDAYGTEEFRLNPKTQTFEYVLRP